jgi:hypothetical protein
MFAPPRTVDTSTKALYSNVIVMSDGDKEPPGWGSATGRLHRTGRGHGMAQQDNPDDWLTGDSIKSLTIEELGDLADRLGVRAAELLS